MFHRLVGYLALVVCFLALGCSGESPYRLPKQESGGSTGSPATMVPASVVTGDESSKLEASSGERKIIFNGTLDVEVKDYGVAYRQLNELMQRHQAFFVKTELRGDSGKKRMGMFTIKVPVAGFQTLVDGIAALGNPVQHTTDSKDVTEEFIDTEARVKNLKAEEEVLNKLLKEAGTRLEEVFRIREQIKNNREQIERAEGRIQALSKLSSLSTITLTLRDREEYVAETAAPVLMPASFGDRASSTLQSSLGVLTTLGQWALLLALTLTPWLPVLAVAALVWWYLRRRTWKAVSNV